MSSSILGILLLCSAIVGAELIPTAGASAVDVGADPSVGFDGCGAPTWGGFGLDFFREGPIEEVLPASVRLHDHKENGGET